jgi:hypothetical protein
MQETSKRSASAGMMRIGPQTSVRRSFGPSWRKRVGQLEFVSTVEADLICAVLDGEHATHVTVPAAKNKLENRQ